MKTIAALAHHTFLEAVRDKVLYLLLFFGLFAFGASRVLAPLALGEGRRITIDVGLAGLSLFGCLMTIFVGHQLIFREVERKTLYFVFARPIRRSSFVLGKYLGLVLTLACATASMGLLLVLVLAASRYEFGLALFQAFGLVFLELSIVAALAVLLASFTTPILAGLLTLAAYQVGHGSGDLFALLESSDGSGGARWLQAITWVVPRLDLYHDTWPVLTGAGFGPVHLALASAYAVIYASACLVLAGIILERRQLAL
ncbi:MAG: ABC transporter permease [Candidatus Eisenbacteria bacterium]|nr:ABC transporter permease [Candidatus Eisenbacteria bacterium]